MTKGNKWLAAVLSSGLVVALATFFVDKAWERWQHAEVGPAYVDGSMRFDGDRLLLLVRNRSDEPLDLVGATIEVEESSLSNTGSLGAYPEVSHIYDAKATSGNARVQQSASGIVIMVDIAQAIEPNEVDQFGVQLEGVAGPVDLSRLPIRASLTDVKGNTYRISR